MKRTLLLTALISLLVLPSFAQKWDTINGAGATCVVGKCVYLDLPANTASVSVVVGGTFSGTLQFELSSDGGATVVSASPASTTAPGTFTFSVAAKNKFQVRASAFTSGTAKVSIVTSTVAIGGDSLPDPGADGACLVSSSGEWARGDCAGTPATDPTPAVTEDTDSVNSTKGIEAPSVTTTGAAAYVLIPDGGTAGANKLTSAATGILKWNTLPITFTIASGSTAVDFPSVAANSCSSAITATATGTATTDVISWGINGDISGVTGYGATGTIRLYVYPTANTFNIKACNADTTNAVDPGSITVNWRISR